MNKEFVATVSLLVFLTCSSFLSKELQSQERMYSTMMLSFSRGMQWPSSETGDFVIGVLEYQPLATELRATTSSLKIGSKKVVIKELSSSDSPLGCHMLFIPAYKARSLQRIVSTLAKEPTVIVTNKNDLARQGSGINFVLVEGKLKYEINSKAIESRGIKVSATIKGMGIAVE